MKMPAHLLAKEIIGWLSVSYRAIESVFGEIGGEEEDVNDRSFALFLYRRRSCEVVEERRKQTE